MKWMVERDALIAQTLAFVQSVTGKKDDVLRPDKTSVASGDGAAPAEPVAIEIEQPKAAEPASPLPPARAISDLRAEMQTRVASFRKHQERFEREREEYCADALKKLRAAIRDGAGPLPKK